MEPNNENSKESTYGERAVGLNFNPGGDEKVNTVKFLYAKIIDLLNELPVTEGRSEKLRLAKIAITEAQSAQMWAVKALTWTE